MMAKIKQRSYIIIFCSIALISCTGEKLDYKNYLKYIAEESNGVTKEKTTDKVKVKVKYLPLDYLAYTAVKGGEKLKSQEELIQLKKQYANSLTFLLTFGPAEGESFSITKYGVQNYEEFAQRIETMSFKMKEYISLELNNKEYMPELVQFESINTLEPGKNLIVVFNNLSSSEDLKFENDMVFIYNDELFYTGINRFTFKSDDLNRIPKLDFKDVLN